MAEAGFEIPTFLYPGAAKECCLSVSNLEASVKYWSDFLQMTLLSKSDKEAVLTYSKDNQCYLRLKQLDEGQQIEHATAYGRIAFSVPEEQVGF